MFVGSKHTAKSEISIVLTYSCENCNHQQNATVTATGKGQAASPMFMVERSAKEVAAKSAQKNAEKSCVETLGMAKCPNCNKRNKSKIRKYWLKQLFTPLGGVGAVTILMIAVFIATLKVSVLVELGIVIIIFASIRYFWKVAPVWTTIDKRVEFIY